MCSLHQYYDKMLTHRNYWVSFLRWVSSFLYWVSVHAKMLALTSLKWSTKTLWRNSVEKWKDSIQLFMLQGSVYFHGNCTGSVAPWRRHYTETSLCWVKTSNKIVLKQSGTSFCYIWIILLLRSCTLCNITRSKAHLSIPYLFYKRIGTTDCGFVFEFSHSYPNTIHANFLQMLAILFKEGK